MSVSVGTATGYLDLDIKGFLQGLKTAQSEAVNAANNIENKLSNKLTSVGNKLTSSGKSLTKSVTTPIVAAGTAVVKMSSDFESAMSKVQAVSGASGKELESLNKKAQQLGATTSYSATEVAEGMTEMAKAGWNAQQIMDGMEGVLNAASASGENLSTVSTIVADAITGFRMEAKEATRVADLLTQAANSGTIYIKDLGESFKYVAPIAGSMGLSIEDVTTALSAMSMAGIKGSQAGTSLRTMLTRMVKPTGAVKAAMNELGISVTNQDGSMKSLDEIVSNLRTSFDGLTESEKAKYAATLAGQEGMSGMLALLNLTEEEYDALSDSMNNCNGVAKETADIMLNNLKGQITILKSALEGLAIQFGEAILPSLKKFTEWIQNLVLKLQELTPEQKEQIVKWAAIAAAIGPVLLVMGKVVTAAGTMIGVFEKIPLAIAMVTTYFTRVTEAMTLAKAGFPALGAEASKLGVMLTGLTAPVAAVIAIIGVLAAAFVSLMVTNEDFRNKVSAIWDEIKTTFANFAQGIVDRLNSLGFKFESITDVIKTLWSGFCDFLAPIFTGAFEAISTILKTATDLLLNILDLFISIFKGDWKGVWEAIKGIFETIWNGIKSFFSNILNTIKGIFDVMLSWFGTSWDECWTNIKSFFQNIWDSISSFFSNVWNTIKNIAETSIMFIVELFKAAFELITTPFRFIWENCKETIMTIWDAIKSKISSVLDAINSVITNVFNAVKEFVSNIWNAIKSAISVPIDAAKNKVSNVVNAIKNIINNVFNAIKDFTSNVWNSIKSKISSPMDSAKSKVSNVVNSIKSIISSGFNAAKNTVSSIFNSIKSKISSVMNAAKNAVSNAINSIKSKFKFTWSLPKLKLPHITISGKFGLDPPSVPKFGISWYKSAMENGMILNAATIFGYNSKTGKFLGAGEAGSETVVGTNSLMRMIKNAVISSLGPIINAVQKLTKASVEIGYNTYDSFVKYKQMLEDIVNVKENKDYEGKGDVFNFYSPKAIDEIEAAKRLKQVKKDLAEDF